MKRKANERYQVEHYLNTTYSNVSVCVCGLPFTVGVSVCVCVRRGHVCTVCVYCTCVKGKREMSPKD